MVSAEERDKTVTRKAAEATGSYLEGKNLKQNSTESVNAQDRHVCTQRCNHFFQMV